MLTRVKIDLVFKDPTDALALVKAARNLMPRSVVINPGQENQESGYVILEKCYHDEDPAAPCEAISTDTVTPEEVRHG